VGETIYWIRLIDYIYLLGEIDPDKRSYQIHWDGIGKHRINMVGQQIHMVVGKHKRIYLERLTEKSK